MSILLVEDVYEESCLDCEFCFKNEYCVLFDDLIKFSDCCFMHSIRKS